MWHSVSSTKTHCLLEAGQTWSNIYCLCVSCWRNLRSMDRLSSYLELNSSEVDIKLFIFTVNTGLTNFMLWKLSYHWDSLLFLIFSGIDISGQHKHTFISCIFCATKANECPWQRQQLVLLYKDVFSAVMLNALVCFWISHFSDSDPPSPSYPSTTYEQMYKSRQWNRNPSSLTVNGSFWSWSPTYVYSKELYMCYCSKRFV